MGFRVGPREAKKIDAAVAAWRIKARRISRDDLEAMKWLFESLMWKQPKSSLRFFMQELFGHIESLEAELAEHKMEPKP